jgi:putative two-component system response regulator
MINFVFFSQIKAFAPCGFDVIMYLKFHYFNVVMMTSAPQSSFQSTILVVDDTPENITVLGELLKPYYSVRVSTNGRRALDSAADLPQPDLILLDVMMPEMDGYEVLAKLRQNPETRDIPVIFITALDGIEDESHGLDLGAADYITKPLRPTIVLARVKAQLELKQARDRLRDQNAWLETEVTRRMRQNQRIQDASMRALASLAETRDNETGNHILRTQAYVNVLASELAQQHHHAAALTPAIIDSYTKAAPLHDIGKVGIPDEILNKPGKFEPEEWAVMQTHSRIGSDAIWRAIQNEEDQTELDFLHIAMDIAHYHHEKWDGSGYPEGLKGNSIPLSARLMALADVFDALISKRVYKSAFTVDKAIEIIVEGKGKHFDPEIVEAFLSRLDDFRNIAARYRDQDSA